MALFNILVDIAARTANFESGMDRIDRRMQAFGEGIKRVTGILAAGGFAAALVETTKRALENGDQLAHLATKAGTAGQAFSELAYAAKISNSSQEDLAKSLALMNRALSEAATGSKEQRDALAALGLTTKDFIGLETDKKFELIADRLSKLKDEGDKTRAAMTLLGRGGSDLGDLFQKGAAGIRAAREEARRLGQSFSDQQLKDMEAANKSIERLESSFSALATTVAAKAAPAITQFFDAVTAGVSGNKVVLLQRQLDFLKSTIATEWDRGNLSPQEVKRRQDEIADLERRLRLLRPAVTHNRGMSLSTEEAPPGFLPDIEPFVVRAQKAIAGADGINPVLRQWDEETRRSLDSVYEEYRTTAMKLEQLRDENVISVDEYVKRMEEAWGKFESASYISPAFITQRLKPLSQYLTTAQQNVQDFVMTFRSSLQSAFDQGGAVGRNFVRNLISSLSSQALYRAIARIGEALNQSLSKGAGGGVFAEILEAIFGNGSGTSGEIAPVAVTQSYVPAYATGTNYVPRTGLALLHKGEAVVPASENNGASGMTFAPVYNIDARGASRDFVDALPEILRRNNEQVKQDILGGIQRRKYPVPR